MISLGDRLGLFESLARHGAPTSAGVVDGRGVGVLAATVDPVDAVPHLQGPLQTVHRTALRGKVTVTGYVSESKVTGWVDSGVAAGVGAGDGSGVGGALKQPT